MIDQLISELVAYGLENGLIDDADKVYVTRLSRTGETRKTEKITAHFG